MAKKIKNLTRLQIDDFKFGHVHGQNKQIYDKFKKSKLIFIIHQWWESLPTNVASRFQGWFGTIPPNNVL